MLGSGRTLLTFASPADYCTPDAPGEASDDRWIANMANDVFMCAAASCKKHTSQILPAVTPLFLEHSSSINLCADEGAQSVTVSGYTSLFYHVDIPGILRRHEVDYDERHMWG